MCFSSGSQNTSLIGTFSAALEREQSVSFGERDRNRPEQGPVHAIRIEGVVVLEAQPCGERFQWPVRKEGSFLQQILAFFTILNLILLQELFHLSALLRPEVLRLARLLDNCGCQEDQQVRFLHRSRI